MLRKYSTSCLLESFRLAMGRVSSQAMILTSATSNLNELHGMTLGSVCSLSVFPSPLIQFNLHLPSYTSSELHKHKYLALHVLPPTKNSVHLSRIFAKGVKLNKGAKLAPTKEEKIDGQVFHEMTKPFTRLQKGANTNIVQRRNNIDMSNTKHLPCRQPRNMGRRRRRYNTQQDPKIWRHTIL